MISDYLQEQSIAYLLHELSPADASAFEAQCHQNSELAAFVRDMRETLGRLAEAAPAATPPAGLRERILAIPRAAGKAVPVPRMEIPVRQPARRSSGWMAAACVLALLAFVILYDDWTQRDRFAQLEREMKSEHADAAIAAAAAQSRLNDDERKLAALKEKDALTTVQVTSLLPQSPAYQHARAIVIWDPARHQGLVRLTGLPPVAAKKTYQLWVIDPTASGPISAGLLTVKSDGTLQQGFQPAGPVAAVQKFAISVEPAGGSPAPKGPIVLIGG